MMKFFFRQRKAREIRTLGTMIRMYCRAHHHPEEDLCDSCAEVLSYATLKYHRCVFGENKPVCTVCPVHCYNREKREQIRVIMRYAGPRMIFRHPVMALDHLVLEYWSKKRLPVFLDRIKGKKKKTNGRKSA